MNTKKTTNKDCFAYNRGNCRSVCDPSCEVSMFFINRSDHINNIKMNEY